MGPRAANAPGDTSVLVTPGAPTPPTSATPASPTPASPVSGPVAVPAPSTPPRRPRREAPGGRDDAGSPVQRALAILELLGAADDASSLGVVEIARQLGRDKSQVSRALKHLADAGFVDREAGSLRYRIGTRLFSIGARAVERRLRDEADIMVEREAARLGERVEVCVRSGGTCMTISTCAPETELRAVGWVGRTVPLSCTAAGRALLFDLDTAAVARLLVTNGLASGGPEAPRSLDEVVVRLRMDQERGFALARHEMDRGLVAVGVPVRDASGRVVAAVSASGPDSRLDPVLEEASALVVRAGQDLSVALGSPTGTPPGRTPGRQDRRKT